MDVNKLLALNVNEHTEKKNGLTYLSWAWAWAEALKADPQAAFAVQTFGDKPYMDVNGTGLVWVTVTLFGKPLTCHLPVMDHRNKPIQNPDAFQVNTAIQRALVKALALHGLGLYIYAGEDLPQVDQEESSEARAEREKRERRTNELDELSLHLIDCHENGKDLDAIRVWYAADTWSADVAERGEEQMYVWSRLKPYSKLRSTIKANKPEQMKEAA